MEEQIQNQTAENPKNSKTLLWLAGVLVVVMVALAGVFLFTNQNSTISEPPTTVATTNNSINNVNDLDKAAKSLDTTNLDSAEAGLSQNDTDALSF